MSNSQPSNYFLMQRGWMKNEAFRTEPFTDREAWIYLIENAAFKECSRRLGNYAVNLSRGELLASIRFLQNAWDWKKNRVEKFLKILENSDMITRELRTGQTVITICNYATYQFGNTESRTQDGHEADKLRTNSGQTTDKLRTNINKDKITIKKEKELETNISENSKTDLTVSEPKQNLNSEKFNQAADEYKSFAKKNSLTVPRVFSPTVKKQTTKAIEILATQDLDWTGFLEIIQNSPHLLGQNDRGWSVKFDWIVKPENFAKILNGNYLQTKSKANHQQQPATPNIFDQMLDRMNGNEAEPQFEPDFENMKNINPNYKSNHQ